MTSILKTMIAMLFIVSLFGCDDGFSPTAPKTETSELDKTDSSSPELCIALKARATRTHPSETAPRSRRCSVEGPQNVDPPEPRRQP